MLAILPTITKAQLWVSLIAVLNNWVQAGLRQFWFVFLGIAGISQCSYPWKAGIVDYSGTSMKPQYNKPLTKSLV